MNVIIPWIVWLFCFEIHEIVIFKTTKYKYVFIFDRININYCHQKQWTAIIEFFIQNNQAQINIEKWCVNEKQTYNWFYVYCIFNNLNIYFLYSSLFRPTFLRNAYWDCKQTSFIKTYLSLLMKLISFGLNKSFITSTHQMLLIQSNIILKILNSNDEIRKINYYANMINPLTCKRIVESIIRKIHEVGNFKRCRNLRKQKRQFIYSLEQHRKPQNISYMHRHTHASMMME